MALAINKNIARGLNTMGYWVGTLFQITPDNSYPTGGYSFPAALLKLGVIEYMAPVFCANAAGTAGVWAVYNSVTAALQFFWGSGSGAGTLFIKGGQAAGTALQVTPDSSSGVIGKQTATDITVPITASLGSGLVEVANGSDLSSYTQGIGVAFGKG